MLQMVFFTKQPGQAVTASNIARRVCFGCINSSDACQTLLKMMHGLYMPMVLSNTTWPETVKTDFMGQIHKFMANLTETVHEVKGKTILYLPKEELSNVMLSSKDKDLVQRLESTIIHWTRQIKEVVNRQDCLEVDQESSGPLAEIDFWRSRSVDLSGIRNQLDDAKVAAIVNVLEHAKSSYLPPFLNLRNLIQREAVAAEDNLKFLLCLEKPCTDLSKAHPVDIPGLMPHILSCIRMVWNVSRFYNTPDRVTVLLRKLSNEIINRCCAVISLPDIFGGDVPAVMLSLQQSILAGGCEHHTSPSCPKCQQHAWPRRPPRPHCSPACFARLSPFLRPRPFKCTGLLSWCAGEKWKEQYGVTAKAIGRHSPSPWDFDVSSIFAHIDAFLQRCRDLMEVCEAQLQFAPTTPLPVFGGTRGTEIEKSIVDIQVSFQGSLSVLRSLTYNILDVKATK
jgi:dynein heavy chain, axonemal